MSPAGRSRRAPWLLPVIAVAVIAVTVATLAAIGHPWICECGTVKLWHGEAVSAETSQHIFDWYSWTHLLHGLLFYFGLWLIMPRQPISLRALVTLILESGWEIVENTPIIMDRYREQTIAFDYFGDSILNSMSDIGVAMLGFLIAWRLPVLVSIAILVGVEVVLAIAIRDNLTLNILMLLYPVPSVLEWQQGGL